MSLSGPLLIYYVGIYVLAAICFHHAWRKNPHLVFCIAAAVVFGYFAEYISVSHVPQPYRYPYYLIPLPGPVPLGICLGWGVIFYACRETATKLSLPWGLRPIFCGCVAVVLDFVMDPVASILHFWIWEIPGQWYGIPWSNFVGWFIVIIAILYMLELGYKWFPPDSKHLIRGILVAFIAIVPAFLIYFGLMEAYVHVVAKKWINEALLVVIIFGLALILILKRLPQVLRYNQLDWPVLAVPLFFFLYSLIALFLSGLWNKYNELVIVFPVLIVLGIGAFLLPYMNTILSRDTDGPETKE